MKKLLILAIAMMSFGAVFAQQRTDKNDKWERNQSNDRRNTNTRINDHSYSNDHVYNNNRQDDRYDNRYDNRDHRADIERVNRDYDQRINGYRNDRSINSYERDRRIRQAEYERTQKINSFGKGVVVGALAAVILGSIF
jgi:hypothetical protein